MQSTDIFLGWMNSGKSHEFLLIFKLLTCKVIKSNQLSRYNYIQLTNGMHII